MEFKRLFKYYGDGTPKIVLQSYAAVKTYGSRLLSGKKTVVAARILVIGLVGYGIVEFSIGQLNSVKNSEKPSYTTKSYESPTYPTVLPSGKSANTFGGWRRVSPPNSSPVYAYVDTVEGVTISVSEQPLPTSFAGDTGDQIGELAQKFNATDKIPAGTSYIYVGTSAKGPQSAILAKGNVLVLIKSEKKISDSAWASYAASLR